MAFGALNTYGFEDQGRAVNHQRCVVKTWMYANGLTTGEMATYLDVDERSLKQYLNGHDIMSVEARVNRWLSVPLVVWNRQFP
jgi:hypothetical protein